MTQKAARYEFRIFAPHLDFLEDKLKKIAAFDRFRESKEIYIVSKQIDAFNIKIRDDVLDIKQKLKIIDRLEQWEPVFKAEFPIGKELLNDFVLPHLGLKSGVLDKILFSLPDLLKMLEEKSPGISVVNVVKRRYGYLKENAILEVASVYINSAHIMTAAVESVDKNMINDLRTVLGLINEENVNYVLAIKRVLGLVPLPESSIYNVLSGV
jgi:hypothetical protein